MYNGLYTILITINIVTTIAISLFFFFEDRKVISYIAVRCYPHKIKSYRPTYQVSLFTRNIADQPIVWLNFP